MTRVGGPPPGVVPSLSHGAAISAVLSDLPPSLRNLALGALLNATVLERNAAGMTMLQTGTGVFGIKTTVPLPPGSTVTLQIQSAGAQVQAIVLSVTPQGAAPRPQQPLPASPPAPTYAAPSTAAAPAPAPLPAVIDRAPTISAAITATVIGPAGGPPPASVPPPAPASTQPAPAPAPSNAAAAPTATAVAGGALPLPAAPAANPAQTAIYQRQMGIVPGTLSAAAPAASAPASPTQQFTAAPPPAAESTPAASAQPAKPLAPLPSGTQVQIRLLPNEPAPAAAPPTQPNATIPTAANVRPASSSPAVATATPSPPSPAATANPTIAGTIVARTPAGQTVVDTPVGRILAALPRTTENAAPGTRVLFELLTAERGAAAARPGILASGPSAIAREWPALRDAVKLLQGSPATEIRAELDRALPKPGPRLAQQMLSFVDAATQGGARAWLGETVMRLVERMGGGEMAARLDTDLRDMLATQRGGDGDWRMTIVPLLDGRELRQIRFFERRKKRDDKDRRRDDPARFVVECDHGELGALQLDGLMHEKRLDVILRSHEPLPQEMERDILTLFGTTCTGLGLNGQLFFQAVPVFPVSPLDDFSGGAVQVSI